MQDLDAPENAELKAKLLRKATRMTPAKFRGYGIEINGVLQNVSFDDAYDAEEWIKNFIRKDHLTKGKVTIQIVRTTVVLAEDQS